MTNRITIQTGDRVESVHATRHTIHRNVWRVENVPFFSTDVHYQDWVLCLPETRDALPAFQEIFEPSGYSTLSIEWVVMDSDTWMTHPIHKAVEALLWPAEGCLTGYVVAVPDGTPMAEITALQTQHKDLLFRFNGTLLDLPIPVITDLDDVDDLPLVEHVEQGTPLLQQAMFDLCRAFATDYHALPQPLLKAYQDRDHSKFDPVLWYAYLDRLMEACRTSKRLPSRVRAAYHTARFVRESVQVAS